MRVGLESRKYENSNMECDVIRKMCFHIIRQAREDFLLSSSKVRRARFRDHLEVQQNGLDAYEFFKRDKHGLKDLIRKMGFIRHEKADELILSDIDLQGCRNNIGVRFSGVMARDHRPPPPEYSENSMSSTYENKA